MESTQQSTRKLRVLSLNCWGLKFVADKRRERLVAIADWIASSASSSSRTSYHSDASDEAAAEAAKGYDVICLQELWCQEDYATIAVRAKEAGLTFSRYFYGGAIGSGLAILSAHPVLSAFSYPYPLNGHALQEDMFAGKGVAGICMDVPGIGKVDVLNTHMFAPGGEGETSSGAHRISQAWELARLAIEKVERGRHVLVMGDLNSQPHSIIMRLLMNHASLTDSFTQTHSEPPSITSSVHRALSPVDALHTHGITCDSPLNTYSAPKLAKRGMHDETVIRGGKRLDYVLYRSPPGGASQMVAETCQVVLTELVPRLNCSYSDHFGLESTITLLPSGSLATPTGQSILGPPPALSYEDLAKATSTLASAYRSSLSRSQLQLRLFAGALLLAPALAIAASFQPLRYLSWLFVLLGVVVGAGGATMLYTGFVGGKWEAGALLNVMTEMESELVRMRANR